MARKPRRWLLGCGVLAFWVSGLWMLLSGRRFDAEATLEYRPIVGGIAESSWQELLATERVILKSRSVCARASARLSSQLICEAVEVERVPSARVLRIQASHHDAATATQIVDSVAQVYLERQAEHTFKESPALLAAFSELDAEGQELDQLEHETESYARERGLLSYDADLERSELALLRSELVRVRIQDITLAAELKQLEQAVETRSYRAARFAADPAFMEQKARLLALDTAVDASDAGVRGSSRAEQVSTLHALALDTVAAVRAELELLRDQRRELTELLAFQEDRLAQRELDLLEVRKRRRIVAEHQALREALLQKPLAESSKPIFSVRILDHGHLVGRSPSVAAWLQGGPLLLLGLGAGAWAARRRLSA